MKHCIRILLIQFLLLGAAQSQVDTAFVKHLQKHGLKTELQQYIQGLKSPADSIAFVQVQYYLAFPQDSLLLKAVRNCGKICIEDSILRNQVSLRMLTAETTLRHIWFDSLCAGKCSGSISLMNMYAEHCLKYPAELVPEDIRHSYEQLQKMHHRSPAMAAIFSTLLPGSGKYYAGKKRTAVSSLIVCSLYAAQWAESNARLGYNHPLSWVNAGFFSVFYLTNIYASRRAVLQLRQEYKKQFLHEAARYYR